MQKESDHVSSDADTQLHNSPGNFEHHTMEHLDGLLELLRSANKKDKYIVSHFYGVSPEPSMNELIELDDLIDKHDE